MAADGAVRVHRVCRRAVADAVVQDAGQAGHGQYGAGGGQENSGRPAGRVAGHHGRRVDHELGVRRRRLARGPPEAPGQLRDRRARQLRRLAGRADHQFHRCAVAFESPVRANGIVGLEHVPIV